MTSSGIAPGEFLHQQQVPDRHLDRATDLRRVEPGGPRGPQGPQGPIGLGFKHQWIGLREKKTWENHRKMVWLGDGFNGFGLGELGKLLVEWENRWFPKFFPTKSIHWQSTLYNHSVCNIQLSWWFISPKYFFVLDIRCFDWKPEAFIHMTRCWWWWNRFPAWFWRVAGD